MSIVDVGFPLYGQKQALLKRDNPNVNVSADRNFQPAVSFYWRRKEIVMIVLHVKRRKNENVALRTLL